MPDIDHDHDHDSGRGREVGYSLPLPGSIMINQNTNQNQQSPQLLSQSQQMAQVSQLLQLQSNASNGQLASEQSLIMNPQQMAAFARQQETSKADSKLNAELCRNFSIGLQHETGGIFTSPNYPNPYPEGLTCTRLIEGKWNNFLFFFSFTFIFKLDS